MKFVPGDDLVLLEGPVGGDGNRVLVVNSFAF